MGRRKTYPYQEEISVCQCRTTLNLGCKWCYLKDNKCEKFKQVHDGLTPYEYNKQKLAEESEENQNEES